MIAKAIANFLFELGMLKRQKHTGFALAGVRQLDSLADHTARAALIGYILAELEGVDAQKVAKNISGPLARALSLKTLTGWRRRCQLENF